MAQFCTKCGNPLPEGMSFCTNCGATVGGAAAPAPPTPLVQAPVAPTAPFPAGPMEQIPVAAEPGPASTAPVAPSKGSPVLKIVLIVVGVLVLFGMLSAGACVYFLYRAKQRMNRFEKQVQTSFPGPTGGVQFPTPPGTPAVPGQSTTPAIDVGNLAYPGATATEGQSQVLEIPGFRVQQYLTSDSVDKVLAYYKDKLGPKAMVTQSGNAASVHIVATNLVVNVAVTVDGASGKTKIAITSIGKQ